jgi:hypothetical protein
MDLYSLTEGVSCMGVVGVRRVVALRCAWIGRVGRAGGRPLPGEPEVHCCTGQRQNKNNLLYGKEMSLKAFARLLRSIYALEDGGLELVRWLRPDFNLNFMFFHRTLQNH